MDHDDLVKEAEELAQGKKTHDLALMAFIYSYVANHELAYLCKDVKQNRWIIVAIGLPILLAVILSLFK